MLKLIRIAFRNIIKNRNRSIMLGSAIIIVTAILIILMAVTSGISDTMLKSSTMLMSGHVNIAGFYKWRPTSAGPLIMDYQNLKRLAIENIPEAKCVVDRFMSWGEIISDFDSIHSAIWGLNFTEEQELKDVLKLADKRDYIEDYKPVPGEASTAGNLDELKNPGNIALFASQAKRLKVEAGDMVTISVPTRRNVWNTKDLRVCAVLKDIGITVWPAVYGTKDDISDLYRFGENMTGKIMRYLKSKKDVVKVQNRLKNLIGDEGYRLMEEESAPFWKKLDRVAKEEWTGQKIDITTWEDEISFMKWIITTFNSTVLYFLVVLMVIIIMGIMNTLWISIRERTKEIGTLRAIGMHRNRVMMMFMIEAFILSAISTASGILIGSGVSELLDYLKIKIPYEAVQNFLLSDELSLIIKVPNLILAFLIITILSTMGAVYPSYRAAKMKPISAINYIG